MQNIDSFVNEVQNEQNTLHGKLKNETDKKEMKKLERENQMVFKLLTLLLKYKNYKNENHN